MANFCRSACASVFFQSACDADQNRQRARQTEGGNECQMLRRKEKNKERSLDGAQPAWCVWERAIDERYMKRGRWWLGRVECCVLPLCLLHSSTPSLLPLSLLSLFLAHYPLHQQTFSLDGSEKNCPLSLLPSECWPALPILINTHLEVCVHTLPSEPLWRTCRWAAVSSSGHHLQMRRPGPGRSRRGTGY